MYFSTFLHQFLCFPQFYIILRVYVSLCMVVCAFVSFLTLFYMLWMLFSLLDISSGILHRFVCFTQSLPHFPSIDAHHALVVYEAYSIQVSSLGFFYLLIVIEATKTAWTPVQLLSGSTSYSRFRFISSIA